MKLYIIRHAQSTNNALADQRDRVSDPDLTELGYQQRDVVAQFLASGTDPEYRIGSTEEETVVGNPHGFQITHLYCSAMHRALLTAQPIGQALGLTPEVWIDIHEFGGIFLDHHDGRGKVGYPGLTRSEILAEFPNYRLPDEVSEEGWWHKGFEERAVSGGRAIVVANQLRERAVRDECIAMVSHGGFIDSLLKALLNQLPSPYFYYHHYNTAITRIDFSADGTLHIRHINRFDHLSHDLLS